MADALAEARHVLDELQSAVDSRDVGTLMSLFDDQAVLIGTTADARDRAGVVGYLTGVATQKESLWWEWRDVVPFHHDAGTLGFAAFGDVVASGANGELFRAPIRATFFAVETPEGWRLLQFHGSIPANLS